MSTLYMMILFFGPRLLIKSMDSWLYKDRRIKAHTHDYIFEIVLHGLATFLFTIGICKLIGFGIDEVNSFSELTIRMDSIIFSAKYLAITIGICLLWYCIYDMYIKKIGNKLRNKIVKKKTGVSHTVFPSVYEGIFHNPEVMLEHLVPITIFQNGQYVTAGTLKAFNSPNSEIFEYHLEHTQEVEQIMKEDEQRNEDEKILPFIMFEYYAPESGLLIKFYNPKRLESYWAELYGENN